jgi:secondary thiamine-phosphate synthase enzyme
VRQVHGEINVRTRGKGLYDITREVRNWVGEQGIADGILTLFLQHTSASLTIQENADPDVRSDLEEFLDRLVPESTKWFRHTTEGSDDMPAHIRAALTSTTLSIPVRRGVPALGTWQAVYVFEHRSVPHRRTTVLHLLGE